MKFSLRAGLYHSSWLIAAACLHSDEYFLKEACLNVKAGFFSREQTQINASVFT